MHWQPKPWEWSLTKAKTKQNKTLWVKMNLSGCYISRLCSFCSHWYNFCYTSFATYKNCCFTYGNIHLQRGQQVCMLLHLRHYIVQCMIYLRMWSDFREVPKTKCWLLLQSLSNHCVTVGVHTCTVAQDLRALPSFYSEIMENVSICI